MAFFSKSFKAAASSWVSRQVDVAIRRGLICLTCHTFCSEGKNKHSLNQYIPVAVDGKKKGFDRRLIFYHFSSQIKERRRLSGEKAIVRDQPHYQPTLFVEET